jgi:GTP-binding protein Era
MRGLIEDTIRDSEIILYMIDVARPLGREEEELSESVRRHAQSMPVFVALNKTDVGDEKTVATVRDWVAERLPDVPVHEISAASGKGVEEILAHLVGAAPEGEAVYPEDHYTDQLPEFRVAEIIREKAINRTSQEVPHSLYVDVADMEIKETEGPREDTLWIRAFLLVERESQKGILVGKAGAKIKVIRQSAQKEIAELFPYRIHLDLRVKVDPKWRHREHILQRLVN